MEKLNKWDQAKDLRRERRDILAVAEELTVTIETAVVGHDVPTAGVVCNLNAVIQAWANEHVKQLDNQITELESCQN